MTSMIRPYLYTSMACLSLFLGGEGWARTSVPIVVELFESQGCSSCPPSERVMASLRNDFGDSVILLTFHVDYWDNLGWKDAFSDPHWTERQKMYGRAFSQDSIYTPEMVIDGEVGFNGADGRRAEEEVHSRLSSSKGPVHLTLSPKSATTTQLSVRLSPELVEGSNELLVVIVEDASPVHVLRGENRGETMTGNFAVRGLKSIPFSSKALAVTTLALPPGADPARTRVGVLVRGNTSRFLSAQMVPWPIIVR